MNQPKPWWMLGAALLTVLFLLFGAKEITRNRIDETKKKEFQLTLNDLITSTKERIRYDNNPLEDVIHITTPHTGDANILRVFRLRYQDEPVAVLIESIEPEGYNGDIKMLVAIASASSKLLGVRVSQHSETPGLGDDIEIKRSNWITQFNGHSLESVSASQWSVKKEGGQFDGLTGATITASAIIRSVQRTLLWYAEQKQQLYLIEAGLHL